MGVPSQRKSKSEQKLEAQLRAQLAGQALIGLTVASFGTPRDLSRPPTGYFIKLADWAVQIADATLEKLAASEKTPHPVDRFTHDGHQVPVPRK